MVIKKLLISLYISIFCFSAFAQMVPPNISPEEQKKLMEKFEADNPEAVQFQKRLMEIQKEVEKIVQDYTMNKLPRKDAREKLRPLLKEQIEIVMSTDFLVAQQLSAFLPEK